jgi:hypothetical protein
MGYGFEALCPPKSELATAVPAPQTVRASVMNSTTTASWCILVRPRIIKWRIENSQDKKAAPTGSDGLGAPAASQE